MSVADRMMHLLGEAAAVRLSDEEWETLAMIARASEVGGGMDSATKSLVAKKLVTVTTRNVFGQRLQSWSASPEGHALLAAREGGEGLVDTLNAVKRALEGKNTKVGGNLRFDGMDAKHRMVSFEPAWRQRLDHYGTSYSDDGEEQEGWDDEGWSRDYARPLAREVEVLLAKAGIVGARVDVGEKGRLHIELPK